MTRKPDHVIYKLGCPFEPFYIIAFGDNKGCASGMQGFTDEDTWMDHGLPTGVVLERLGANYYLVRSGKFRYYAWGSNFNKLCRPY